MIRQLFFLTIFVAFFLGEETSFIKASQEKKLDENLSFVFSWLTRRDMMVTQSNLQAKKSKSIAGRRGETFAAPN